MGFQAAAFKSKHTQTKPQLNLWIRNLLLHCDLFLGTAAGPFYSGCGKTKAGVSSTLGRWGWWAEGLSCPLCPDLIQSWTRHRLSVESVKVAQLCPTLGNPWTIQSMEFSGQSPGGGSLSLLQGIFPTQESNQVSCIAGRFFTS